MIRLPPLDLPPAARDGLSAYQAEIDAHKGFAKRVAAAKALFKGRNTTTNATFKAVRAVLAHLCHGARRCNYCEDSVADEVEHVRPKDWYPEAAFVWENYLYACGSCNGPKNNRFRIFRKPGHKPFDLERAAGAPVRRPPAGPPLLIDPRTEDPLAFLELDLSGTFYFLPREGLTKRATLRAEYTIELLRLNARDVLTRARRNAFGTYRARLEQYVTRKERGESAADLKPFVDDLRQVPHPTVWEEMKRQSADYPELKKWFGRAPEALGW